MQVIIKSKNLNPSDALESKIIAKIGKLEKYFSSDTVATVMLSEVKTGLAKLEATIHAGGTIFRAEESNADLFFCLDKVMDKLSAQTRRYKKKMTQKHKEQKEIILEQIPDMDEALQESEIVKTKTIPLAAISTDEAILQMELLDHSFFAFRNLDTGKVSIIYKRADGQYGLLITE